MEQKRDVQDLLIKTTNEKVSQEEFLSILKLVSPGTSFRTALDGALKTGKGALIVVENESLLPIIDGGFRINCKFTPQKLIELSKMDGALVLSKDMKRINHANVLLTPSSQIKSSETGTRHKAAERTAKQTKTLAVAISERRSEITLFYKNIRYMLQSPNDILRKASEHIHLLENQRELFDTYVSRLTKSEFYSHSNLDLAITLIQKGMLIQKIIEDLRRQTVELGKEGTLLKIRLKEIKGGVAKETDLAIKDYTKLDIEKSKFLIENLSYDEILDERNIFTALACEENLSRTEPVNGWRILAKTSLEEIQIAEIIRKLSSIDKIIRAESSQLTEILKPEQIETFRSEIEKINLNA